MRLHDIINEAPIADLEVQGSRPDTSDPEKGKMGYTQPDYDLLTSQKGVQKIMNAFSKTPFVFNFYVLFPNEDERRRPYLQRTKRDVEAALGHPIQTDGRITVVYTNNVTAPGTWQPMNAWTLAHRVAHAAQASGMFLPCEQAIWKTLVALYNRMGGQSTYKGEATFPATREQELTMLSNFLLTMKSARESKIRNPLDVGGEIMSQYLLTGNVRLNRVDNWDFNRPLTDNLWEGGISSDQLPTKDLNAIIEEAERRVNFACEVTFTNLVGKIIAF
jgi:hypothetical protein